MKKILIRTLGTRDGYWRNEEQKEKVKESLNAMGFYATDVFDALEVYVLVEENVKA